MTCLHYRNTELYIENVCLNDIAAEFGTPCYVYSKAALENNWRAFDTAFSSMPHRICYAVKANSNIAILHVFAQLQSGFDIVSLGELERVIAAGGSPKKIVFSGVAKTAAEMQAAMRIGVDCFNVESEPELLRLQTIAAELQTTINIALRINPNVDPRTHSHISTGLKENKFGIDSSDVIPLCKQIASLSNLRLIGIACHIGSQITELQPILLAAERLLEIYTQLQTLNIKVQHINVGGGLGIIYHNEQPPTIHEYANILLGIFSRYPVEIIIEPGRAIAGNAGVLLTRVEYLKLTSQKNFVIVDAGMNDLLRPALYNAWQPILATVLRDTPKQMYDIAGPVCESSDFLGKDRELALHAGDILAVDAAGAYGFSMSSNYNSRPRPPEIMVDGNKIHLIRKRESTVDLFALENII